MKFIKIEIEKTLISALFDFIKKEKNRLIKKYNCIFIIKNPKILLKKLFQKLMVDMRPSPQYKIDKNILKKNKKTKNYNHTIDWLEYIDINLPGSEELILTL